MFFFRHKIIFILFVVTFTYAHLTAQEYSAIENISRNTQLQNHNITGIVQDSQGFLWVGTNLGLYRYDGYNFKLFSVNTNPTLLNNNIRSLLIDGDNLWIASKGGINILNTRTNENKMLIHNKNDAVSLATSFVTKLFRDGNNTIWVGYNTNKISKYLGNYKFQNFTLGVVGETYMVKNIIEEDNNYIINLIDEKAKRTKIVAAFISENNFITKVINEGVNTSQVLFKLYSYIYLIQNKDIFIFNTATKSFKKTSHKINSDDALQGEAYVDNYNTVYVGTTAGLFHKLTLKNGYAINKVVVENKDTRINTFFVDNSKLLWVGTSTGLFKLKKQHFLFSKYLQSHNLSSPNKMRSIVQDVNGDLFAVNQNNLFKYDSIKNVFENLNWINEMDTSPYSIIENGENNFLIGTQGEGIGIYNKTSNTLKNYFKNKIAATYNTHVLKLFKDATNLLWIGTLNGLNYFDQNKDNLVIDFQSNNTESTINKDAIYDIKQESKNILWVGTSTGLYHLKINYSIEPINIEVTKITHIPYEIRNIFLNKSILWLATQSHGIVKYNKNSQKIEIFDEVRGLSNNTTYSILSGSKNELWIGTQNGLSRFDTINNQFLNFYKNDGLAANEFNSSSQLKKLNKELLFGGQNGITRLNPSDFEEHETYSKLNITAISWYNTQKKNTYNMSLLNNDIKPLELPFSNAFLKVELALTNYFEPESNSYKYRLNGFHSDWRILKKTNVLSFTNLPPGDYNLEIFGATTDGMWNKNAIILPIKVNQIFYKKWWFITLNIILFLLIMFFIRKYELDHINKLEQLRLRISRDLHDELGSSLTGIAIKSDLLSEKIDVRNKKEVLAEISEQSRVAVDSLSDIVWAIDSTNNTIQQLSERMESIMYQFLSPLNITFNFQTLANGNEIELDQDLRQHVFLIFKEAITNVMKHSNANHVNVSITKYKKKFKLAIADNGTITSKKPNNLNGNGMKNMKIRAVKINGDLKISKENGYSIELMF